MAKKASDFEDDSLPYIVGTGSYSSSGKPEKVKTQQIGFVRRKVRSQTRKVNDKRKG